MSTEEKIGRSIKHLSTYKELYVDDSEFDSICSKTNITHIRNSIGNYISADCLYLYSANVREVELHNIGIIKNSFIDRLVIDGTTVELIDSTIKNVIIIGNPSIKLRNAEIILKIKQC